MHYNNNNNNNNNNHNHNSNNSDLRDSSYTKYKPESPFPTRFIFFLFGKVKKNQMKLNEPPRLRVTRRQHEVGSAGEDVRWSLNCATVAPVPSDQLSFFGTVYGQSICLGLPGC